MRKRMVIAGALVASLTSFSSQAKAPADAPAVPITPVDSIVAPPVPPAPPAADMLSVGRVARDVHDTEVPYLFECEFVRWSGDPANETRTVRRLEGILGDEPVHFEADSFLIDDEQGRRAGGYTCRIEVGKGKEMSDDERLRPPDALALATMGGGAHGHVMWEDEKGRPVGIAGARFRRGYLQRGEQWRWDWSSMPTFPNDRRIVHSADCEGITIVRGYSRSDVGGWCEHENPPRRNVQNGTAGEDHDTTLPVDVPVDVPVEVPTDEPDDLPVDVPVDVPITIPDLPVGVLPDASSMSEQASDAVLDLVASVKIRGAGEEI